MTDPAPALHRQRRLARWAMGSFAAVQARGPEDADRFLALGAPAVDTPGGRPAQEHMALTMGPVGLTMRARPRGVTA